MKRAVEFLKNVKKDDAVVIVFNNDGDGICSCVLVKNLLESRGIGDPYILAQPMPTEKSLIRKIQTTVPDKIIFLDLAMDQQDIVVRKLKGICDILVVDHHKVYKDLNDIGVAHYNPRFGRKDVYQSTTYVTYKICSKIQDMSDFLWLAAVGMISDYNLEDSMDLIGEVRKRYDVKEDDMYDTFFGRIADMIVASAATKTLSCEQMVTILSGVEDVGDFQAYEGTEKMVASYQKIENEKMSLIDEAKRSAEQKGNVVAFEIKSKYNLRSVISTILSESYPDKIMLVYAKSGNRVNVSARNQTGRFDVGGILKRATRGLKGSAGGHDAAAGGHIRADDWDEFLRRVVSYAK